MFFSISRAVVCPLMGLALMLTSLADCSVWAQDAPAAKSAAPEENASSASVQLKPYAPDADPAELIKQVDQTWQTPIQASSEIELRINKMAVLRHIIAGAELVLKHADADEPTALKAVQNKMQALGILARSGDPAAPQQAFALAQDLAEDERPLLAREGRLILLSSQLGEIGDMNKQQRDQFASDLLDLISKGDLGSRELEIANVTATLFEQAGDLKAAQQIYEKTAGMMKQSKSPQIRAQFAQFAGAARRVGLPGNTMKIAGETLSGEALDLTDYKGKVVLVQFWASWCTYCLQEMPNIKQQYNIYHDDGFEVIGINLDDSAARAKQIVEEMKLPWPNLFSSDPAAMGMENPIASYYGVNGIPLCILIDREGKVVSLEARGETLNRELEKLFFEAAEKQAQP